MLIATQVQSWRVETSVVCIAPPPLRMAPQVWKDPALFTPPKASHARGTNYKFEYNEKRHKFASLLPNEGDIKGSKKQLILRKKVKQERRG